MADWKWKGKLNRLDNAELNTSGTGVVLQSEAEEKIAAEIARHERLLLIQQELNKKIAALEKILAEKNKEIASLKETIDFHEEFGV